MNTKLTLKLKRTTVERGKKYAKKKKTSFSKLVEGYIENITQQPGDVEISPFVRSLTGILPEPTTKYKQAYTEYLVNKYK